MPELLKDQISKELVKQLTRDLKELNSTSFEKDIFKDLEKLELKERIKLISNNLNKHLKGDYSEKIERLKRVVHLYSGLSSLIFTDFILLFGLHDYDTSIEAIELFTQHGTAEFAIRPFIEKYPKTMEQILLWSKHENMHVRRLASEGIRPRLPWAQPLRGFITDPTPLIPILENLKDAEEDYVYRSVANCLNDISKDHPDVALSLARKWKNSSKSADWAVKHGMRTLLKKGNPEVFELFDYASLDFIGIKSFGVLDGEISIGESTQLNLNLDVKKTSKPFRIDYIIHFVKSNGTSNAKVFSFKEGKLNPGKIKLSKKLNFKNLSTRKHYSGMHQIDLVINGVKQAETKLTLLQN